jgi:integrase
MARWRDDRGRQCAKVFTHKEDAEKYEREIRRRKDCGELDLLNAGKISLNDFAREQFWPRRTGHLADNTRRMYAHSWDKHVLPALGAYQLRELRPSVIEDWRTRLEETGIGPAAIGWAMALLRNVLERAVEWEYIPRNAAAHVRKPSQMRKRDIEPPTLDQIELIRKSFLDRRRRGDATLISVLAYAGLRPGEALALSWRHVREQTLLVERSNDAGKLKPTKTGRTRTVRLLRTLARDLAELRMASGRPDADALIFPDRSGSPWGGQRYRNWRRRQFEPAAEVAGLLDPRPYDLRHGFTSLLAAEGRNVYEIARQLGHKPSMTLDTYGHVLEELAGRAIEDLDSEIRAARGRVRSRRSPAPAQGAAVAEEASGG